MIREAIKKQLKELGISSRQCALDNNIQYSNFNNFLLDKRPMPLHYVEQVLKYLNLQITTK